MNDTIFELKNVTIQYATQVILENENLTISQRGVTCLIGKSGQGKSTLLRCLNRLNDSIDDFSISGDILFSGRSIYDPGFDVTHLRKQVGLIMQRPVMFRCSIYDNVVFGLKPLRKISKTSLGNIVEKRLKEVLLFDEVKDRLNAPACTLSIGQQQRLSIARALAVNPSILLMDEPTSALDKASEKGIEDLVQSLKDQVPIIFVTHKMDQVTRLADTVVEIKNKKLIKIQKKKTPFAISIAA